LPGSSRAGIQCAGEIYLHGIPLFALPRLSCSAGWGPETEHLVRRSPRCRTASGFHLLTPTFAKAAKICVLGIPAPGRAFRAGRRSRPASLRRGVFKPPDVSRVISFLKREKILNVNRRKPDPGLMKSFQRPSSTRLRKLAKRVLAKKFQVPRSALRPRSGAGWIRCPLLCLRSSTWKP